MYRYCVMAAKASMKLATTPTLVGLTTFVVAGFLATSFVSLSAAPAFAKGPGTKYCFYSTCHRVKTIAQTRELVGEMIPLHASHYDFCGRDRYNPCGLTSSGEKFHPERPDNAASPIYPDGTVLLIWNKATNAAAVVRINNAGPYWGKRKLDVSYATADKLGFAKRGVAELQTMILRAPQKAETRYVKNRRYAPVLGYIGKYDDFETAQHVASAIMAVEAIAGSAGALATSGAVIASRYETPEALKKREKTAKQEKLIKTAMLATETRWPDFARVVAAAENKVAPVALRTRVVARTLPSATPGTVTTVASLDDAAAPAMVKGRSRTTINSQTADLLLQGENETSLDRGPVFILASNVVVLRPAKPAIQLVRARDVGAPSAPLWLQRDRLESVFKLSRAGGYESFSAVQVPTPSITVAQLPANRATIPAPNPGSALPRSQKTARQVTLEWV